MNIKKIQLALSSLAPYQAAKFFHCTALILGSRRRQYSVCRNLDVVLNCAEQEEKEIAKNSYRAAPFFLPLTLIFTSS